MRLLVTRPEPDALQLKAQLIGMGHEVLVEPLLRVELIEIDPEDVDLREAHALIATSRNAVRALARSQQATSAADLPIYAVGPGTASSARALGYSNVIQGPRDASALVGTIAQRADVNAGPLVYLGGEVKAGDVAGELRRLGFHVQEPVVYRVVAPQRMSAPIVQRFEAGQIDGVLLMSPQTARIYLRLIRLHGLDEQLSAVKHYCLSENVAAALGGVEALRTVVAAYPNQPALLAAIARGVVNLP